MKAIFQNFLSSGIDFDQSEEPLAFRIRFLNAVALIAIVASIAFILLDEWGIRRMDPVTVGFTTLEALVAFLLILALRGRKQRYLISAHALVLISYLTFTSALLFILNDELRPVWYLIWVVAAYVLLGNTVGLVTTGVSMVTVVYAKYFLSVPVSGDALYTFVLTMAVASGMTYAYTNLANSYYRRLGRQLRQLQALANRDALTGLWNARFVADAAAKLFALARRNGQPIALLFIDIDHFKSINDRHGHQVGDQVLRGVAQELAAQLRQSDLLGRIGGEEFVVLMPDTNLRGARTLAEQLRTSVQALAHRDVGEPDFRVTVSLGVALILPSDQCAMDMQKRADAAMYLAKKQGRNRVAVAPEQDLAW